MSNLQVSGLLTTDKSLDFNGSFFHFYLKFAFNVTGTGTYSHFQEKVLIFKNAVNFILKTINFHGKSLNFQEHC